MKESASERRGRFDALFASYSSDIVAYCGWRAASASDSQDAVADVFLTAWRRLDELPEDREPEAFAPTSRRAARAARTRSAVSSAGTVPGQA